MNEQDFQQAIRLLHVWQAWAGIGGSVELPAKDDPLYPGLHMPHQTPLINASAELLARYPYQPIASRPQVAIQMPESEPAL